MQRGYTIRDMSTPIDSMPPFSDRRRKKRVPMDTPVSLSPDDPFEQLPAEMFAIDVSSGGIAFEGPSELKGERYHVQIDLPSGAQVKGIGRVVWKQPNSFSHSYGVELERINWWEKHKLKNYIRRYLRAKGVVSMSEKLTRFIGAAAATAVILSWLLTKIKH